MAAPPKMLAPVVTDNSVIVAYGDLEANRIASFDVGNGRPRWTMDFPQARFIGALWTCQGLMYANTRADEAYVLRVQNGASKTRLKDTYVWACNSRLILVTSWSQKAHQPPAETLSALDAQTLRSVWRKALAPWRVHEMQVEGDKVALVLIRGWWEIGHVMRQRVTVRAADGYEVLRGKPEEWLPNRTIGDPIPKTLPQPARTRLTRLLARQGGVFIGCTRVLRLRDLFFAGNREDSTAPSKVYAIRGSTGQIVWQQPAPGLLDIALGDTRVFVAYGLQQKHAMRRNKSLMALDAETGRVLWTTELGRSTPAGR